MIKISFWVIFLVFAHSNSWGCDASMLIDAWGIGIKKADIEEIYADSVKQLSGGQAHIAKILDSEKQRFADYHFTSGYMGLSVDEGVAKILCNAFSGSETEYLLRLENILDNKVLTAEERRLIADYKVSGIYEKDLRARDDIMNLIAYQFGLALREHFSYLDKKYPECKFNLTEVPGRNLRVDIECQ